MSRRIATDWHLPKRCHEGGAHICDEEQKNYFWTCKEELWQRRDRCPLEGICIQKGLSEIDCVQETNSDDSDGGF